MRWKAIIYLNNITMLWTGLNYCKMLFSIRCHVSTKPRTVYYSKLSWMLCEAGLFTINLGISVQSSISHQILIYTTIWIDTCTLDVAISSITPKPYILKKNLFLWICCKCLAWWAWSFLTSEVVEAVGGQKHHISTHAFAL